MPYSTSAIAGASLEMFDAGAGAPVLFLHGCDGLDPAHRYAGKLGEQTRLIAPSHPGFGRSALPDWITEVDDIAYIYLGLLDRLRLATVDLVGCSIGGWIAAEMATKAPGRFRRIVLSAPVGVKTGPTDRLDIRDIFAMPEEQLAALMFHDPATGRLDATAMPDEQLAIRLLIMGQAGFLEHDETVAGIRHFARHVYPALKEEFPDTMPTSDAPTAERAVVA